MKHKQNGSVHIIVIGVLIVLVTGALTYALIKNLDKSKPIPVTSDATSQPKKTAKEWTGAYVEFEDWKVRFPSNTFYTLKRNSATSSNQTAYFISIQELAKTCTNPDTPWLGIIRQFDNPEQKQTIGPDAGKTINQIFGSKGITIDGKIYYYSNATQFCTRNTSNPEVEQAAKKLEAEIKSLEAY